MYRPGRTLMPGDRFLIFKFAMQRSEDHPVLAGRGTPVMITTAPSGRRPALMIASRSASSPTTMIFLHNSSLLASSLVNRASNALAIIAPISLALVPAALGAQPNRPFPPHAYNRPPLCSARPPPSE